MHRTILKSVLILSILLGFLHCPAYATKECVPPDAQWFADNIIKKSDLVIYAKITDYSLNRAIEKKWTEVSIIKTLYGEPDKSGEVKINNWQANDHPLYGYDKGDYLVLWLNKDGLEYKVTDLSWIKCVPSIWYAKDNETARNIVDYKWHSLKEIEGVISKALHNK